MLFAVLDLLRVGVSRNLLGRRLQSRHGTQEGGLIGHCAARRGANRISARTAAIGITSAIWANCNAGVNRICMDVLDFARTENENTGNPAILIV